MSTGYAPPGPSSARRAVIATLLAAGSAPGCSAEATLGSFTVDEELPPTRVAGAGVAGVLPVAFPPLALDVGSTEDYRSGDYDYVTRVSVRELVLGVADDSESADDDLFEDGMPDDLSFLSSIDLHIVATVDGIEREARLGGVPENDPRLDAGVRSVSLDMTGVDILDYVEAPAGYAVRVEATGSPPPDDVTFEGDVEYRVSVGFR